MYTRETEVGWKRQSLNPDHPFKNFINWTQRIDANVHRFRNELLSTAGIYWSIVLLTLWQKLHTVSRPTLTSEGTRRSTLNLVEWWTMRKIEADPRGSTLSLSSSLCKLWMYARKWVKTLSFFFTKWIKHQSNVVWSGLWFLHCCQLGNF